MNNSWAPFASKIDWEVVRWAKLHGPGSTAFSGLLQIDGLVDTIGLSFKNSKQLNDIVDKQLPNPHPKFNHREIKIAGQSFDLFSCDVIECIKALYGDPEHNIIGLSSYNKVSTYQEQIITASHLNQPFPCKHEICSFTIERAGIHGIKLTSGDGATRRCHPIYATYVGDYPEQCLVTGVITGDCPICECPHNELGLYPSNHPVCKMKAIWSLLQHSHHTDYLR
ncbi:Para aminobenzoic acid synthetase [Salix suchowensis]|nr:Para aminobenzoic acid synthetase [Salix suchowensis]